MVGELTNGAVLPSSRFTNNSSIFTANRRCPLNNGDVLLDNPLSDVLPE